MKTYKGSIGNLSLIITGGDTVSECIRETWKRKYNCEVLSITQPYDNTCYHIEHSGRSTTRYHYSTTYVDNCYTDDFKLEKELEQL